VVANAHEPGASVWQRWHTLVALAHRHPEVVGAQPPTHARLQALLDRAGVALRIVGAAPRGTYEARVVAGELPCREGSWHDTFNVVAFATFPGAKRALHARVHTLRGHRGPDAPTRTREEDTLTLLDETCVLVAGGAHALAQFDAARACDDLAQMDRLVRGGHVHARWFGHALIEHLLLERPPVGAGVLALCIPEVAPDRIAAAMDETLARIIAAGELSTPRYAPTLPWPHVLVDAWGSDQILPCTSSPTTARP
jgi:hypothetical protein